MAQVAGFRRASVQIKGLKRAILQEKKFDLKLSGNKVYCMNALLLLINIMLSSKLHYQKVLIETLFQQDLDPEGHSELGSPQSGIKSSFKFSLAGP